MKTRNPAIRSLPPSSPFLSTLFPPPSVLHLVLVCNTARYYCCTLSQHRQSFDVNIGFGWDFLRRQGVLTWYISPRRVDACLAYRILSAGLVPVNDMGTQAYEYYCRVSGMVSRISGPTLLARFMERKEVTSLWYKSRDILIRSVVPLFAPNLDPSNSIAI